MDRRTVLLGGLGLTLPAAAYTSQTAQTKSLVVKARTGDLADTALYTNSFAVLVGITYPKFPANLQIPQANADVYDLKALLVSAYGFLAENVLVLKDTQATKKGIERALANLADRKRVTASDRVLVYFSCHGQTIKTQDGGDQGFLIPVDADIDLKDTANPVPYLSECIPMDSLWRYLEASPARHRLLIADACFAGLTVQSKSFPKPSAATLKGFLAVPALQAIAAGGKGEEALVLPGLRNSAFTHKLLEVLRQAAASGEIVTASLLGAQLKTSVPDLVLSRTNGKLKQTPQFGSRGTEGEWLFVPMTKNRVKASVSNQTTPAVSVAVSTTISLELIGVPDGAKVTVDDVLLNGRLYTSNIAEKSKEVEVSVSASGFMPYVVKVTLKRGSSSTLSVPLVPIVVEVPSTKVTGSSEQLVDISRLLRMGGGIKVDLAKVQTVAGSAATRSDDMRATFKPDVELSKDLRARAFNARVLVEVEVTASGDSTTTLIGTSGDGEIDKAVLATLRRWKWVPGYRDGNEVTSKQKFEYIIRIN